MFSTLHEEGKRPGIKSNDGFYSYDRWSKVQGSVVYSLLEIRLKTIERLWYNCLSCRNQENKLVSLYSVQCMCSCMA